MPWGRVTITYPPTGYTQNYKRNHVDTHVQESALVAAAVADSVARIGGQGVQVTRSNMGQGLPDPGPNYRVI